MAVPAWSHVQISICLKSKKKCKKITFVCCLSKHTANYLLKNNFHPFTSPNSHLLWHSRYSNLFLPLSELPKTVISSPG